MVLLKVAELFGRMKESNVPIGICMTFLRRPSISPLRLTLSGRIRGLIRYVKTTKSEGKTNSKTASRGGHENPRLVFGTY